MAARFWQCLFILSHISLSQATASKSCLNPDPTTFTLSSAHPTSHPSRLLSFPAPTHLLSPREIWQRNQQSFSGEHSALNASHWEALEREIGRERVPEALLEIEGQFQERYEGVMEKLRGDKLGLQLIQLAEDIQTNKARGLSPFGDPLNRPDVLDASDQEQSHVHLTEDQRLTTLLHLSLLEESSTVSAESGALDPGRSVWRECAVEKEKCSCQTKCDTCDVKIVPREEEGEGEEGGDGDQGHHRHHHHHQALAQLHHGVGADSQVLLSRYPQAPPVSPWDRFAEGDGGDANGVTGPDTIGNGADKHVDVAAMVDSIRERKLTDPSSLLYAAQADADSTEGVSHARGSSGGGAVDGGGEGEGGIRSDVAGVADPWGNLALHSEPARDVVVSRSKGYADSPDTALFLEMEQIFGDVATAKCSGCGTTCSCTQNVTCSMPAPDKAHCKAQHALLTQCEMTCLPLFPFDIICNAIASCVNQCKISANPKVPPAIVNICRDFCGCKKFCIAG